MTDFDFLEVPTWGLGVCFTPRVFLPKKKRPRMFLVQEKRPWHGRFIPPSLWKRLRVFPSGAETPAVYRYRFLCISECQKNMKGKGLKEDFRAPTVGPLILRQAHVLSLSLFLLFTVCTIFPWRACFSICVLPRINSTICKFHD